MIRLDRFQPGNFDRGASRFKEALWYVVKTLCFLTAWPVPSRFKVWLLRRFGAKVGCGAVIRRRVNITFPWRLGIGDHVWIGEETLIISLDEVIIGSHVCLSQRAFPCTGWHDIRSENFDPKIAPFIVEDGCWIAAQAFVGPGVTVGAGSRRQRRARRPG